MPDHVTTWKEHSTITVEGLVAKKKTIRKCQSTDVRQYTIEIEESRKL